MENIKHSMQYTQLRKERIFRNLQFISNKMIIMTIITAFALTYFGKGIIDPNITIIATYSCLQYVIAKYISEHKLIPRYEDYMGFLIYLGSTICYFAVDYYLNFNNQFGKFFAPRGMLATCFLIALFLIQDFKTEIICKHLQTILHFVYQIYFKEAVFDYTELMDFMLEHTYFIAVCYIMQELNRELFDLILNNMDKLFINLSAGIDKISENLILVDISDVKDLTVKFISDNFYQDFAEHFGNNKENPNIKTFLKRFKNIKPKTDNDDLNLTILSNNDTTSASNTDKICRNLFEEVNRFRDIRKQTNQENLSFYIDLKNKVKSKVYQIFSHNSGIEYCEVIITNYTQEFFNQKQEYLLLRFNKLNEKNNNFYLSTSLKAKYTMIQSFISTLALNLKSIKAQIKIVKKQMPQLNKLRVSLYNSINDSFEKIKTISKSTNTSNNIEDIHYYCDNIKDQIKNISREERFYIDSRRMTMKFIDYNNYKAKSNINIFVEYFKEQSESTKIFSKSVYSVYQLIEEYINRSSVYINNDSKINRLKHAKQFIIQVNRKNFLDLFATINLLLSLLTNRNDFDLDFNQKSETEIVISIAMEGDYNIIINRQFNDEIQNNLKKVYRHIIAKLLNISSFEMDIIYDDKTNVSKIEIKTSNFNKSRNNLNNKNDLDLNAIENNSNLINNDAIHDVIFEEANEGSNANTIKANNTKFLVNINDLIMRQESNLSNETLGLQSEFDYESVIECSPVSKIEGCGCFKVLIVDDDLLCVTYLMNVVKNVESNIETANNGYIATQKLKQMLSNSCNNCKIKKVLVLLDVHMPIMNGIDAASKIGELLSTTDKKIDCKFYFISGNSESQCQFNIKDMPLCLGFSNKPIKKSSLLKLVQDQLEIN